MILNFGDTVAKLVLPELTLSGLRIDQRREGITMNDEMFNQLRLPFDPKHLTWKPGATKGDKCMALAYADLRAYMNRLDEVCGPEWHVAYEPWGDDRLICRLTITGITRSSTGEMDSGEEKSGNGGTVAEAQSFKRACAMFGLGRSLYDLPSPWTDFDPQRKRITDSGLAQLKSRYETWYAKTMAATTKAADKRTEPVRVVDADTGEIVSPEPATDSLGDVLFAPDPARVLASQAQRNLMHKLALEYYKTKENWEKKRPEWVRDASGGAVESSNDLSPEQVDWIISLLQQRIAKRAAANAQEPIATVA